MLLAQVEAGGEVAKSAIENAAKFGPEVFLFVFMVLIMAIFGGIHYYFVHIPNSKASRKNQELLTQAITQLSPVVAETRDLVEANEESTEKLRDMVHKVIKTMKIKIEILKRISKIAKIDISDELSQMSGVLMEDD